MENNLLKHIRNKIYFFPYRSFLGLSRTNISRKLIFANSKFTAEAVKAELGVAPHVLYPPVGDDFLNHRGREFDRQRANTVTTVARISEIENIRIIPRIAELTSKEVSFILVGILQSEKALGLLSRLIKELKLSDRMQILTNVERERLRRILLSSKVYLHTVIKEHFGISIVEAMSCGCIPVTYDSGGPRELVSKEFRYTTIEEAAKKVEKAINSWSPETARKIHRATYRFSEKNFSKQFIELFNSHVHCKTNN
jgi:glycosyltransferase involved in cell wall biosynthesis